MASNLVFGDSPVGRFSDPASQRMEDCTIATCGGRRDPRPPPSSRNVLAELAQRIGLCSEPERFVLAVQWVRDEDVGEAGVGQQLQSEPLGNAPERRERQRSCVRTAVYGSLQGIEGVGVSARAPVNDQVGYGQVVGADVRGGEPFKGDRSVDVESDGGERVSGAGPLEQRPAPCVLWRRSPGADGVVVTPAADQRSRVGVAQSVA